MNGSDCLDVLNSGRDFTDAEKKAIKKGDFHFDEDGSLEVHLKRHNLKISFPKKTF